MPQDLNVGWSRTQIRRASRLITIGAVATAMTLGLAAPAQACTRILWNNNEIAVLSSRSMDWPGNTDPVLFAYPRGINRTGDQAGSARVAMVNPAAWTSRFGSVVTRAFGVGAPDGLNDRGLAVHALWFNPANYGPRDASRKGILVTSWPQYLLDNAATVEQAIELQQGIQPIEVELNGGRAPVAVAVEDASGDSVIMQYLDGELIIHHGPEHTVVTDGIPYDEALALLETYDFSAPSNMTVLPGNTNAADRFIRASYFRKYLSNKKPMSVREAVTSLLSVARNVSRPDGSPRISANDPGETDYRTVADLTNLTYYFESKASLGMQWVDVRKLDLRRGAPTLAFDPQKDRKPGNITARFRAV